MGSDLRPGSARTLANTEGIHQARNVRTEQLIQFFRVLATKVGQRVVIHLHAPIVPAVGIIFLVSRAN